MNQRNRGDVYSKPPFSGCQLLPFFIQSMECLPLKQVLVKAFHWLPPSFGEEDEFGNRTGQQQCLLDGFGPWVWTKGATVLAPRPLVSPP